MVHSYLPEGEDQQVSGGRLVTPADPPDEERTLVVLRPEAPQRSLRAVLRKVDLAGSGCHLLLVYPTSEYEARRRARLEAGLDAPYAIDQLAEEARLRAHQLGAAWLSGLGVTYEATGSVGRTGDAVRRAVDEHGYTRIYVPRTRPTFWGRLVDGRRDEGLRWALPSNVRVVSL